MFFIIFLIDSFLFAQSKHKQNIFVTDLQIFPVNQDTIELTWSIPENTKGNFIISYSIYRNKLPFINAETLNGLEPISKVNGSYISYRDKLYDDSNYFYAVIVNVVEDVFPDDYNNIYFDEDYDSIPNDNHTPCFIIIPGENTNITGVHALKESNPDPIQKQEDSISIKKRINPIAMPNSLYNENEETKKEQKISDETEEYALDLINKPYPSQNIKMEQFIFSEDFITPTGGEDYLLFEILIESFTKEKYEEAAKLFTAFLAQNRSQVITQKAIFYLGESQYFLGNYTKALNCFLQVYDAYPSLARKWIDSSLDFIK